MRCPFCASCPTGVKKTTRPLDEGLEEGDVKQRLRKCRNCSRNFFTYEIHEDLFRQLNTAPTKKRLTRQPLLAEDKQIAKPRSQTTKLDIKQ